MILEGDFGFGIPAITNSNAATVSTNVYDSDQTGTAEGATPAKVLFMQGWPMPQIWFRATITADGGTISITVDFVSADNLALTTLPILLGSSGTILTDADGSALVTGDTVERTFPVRYQRVAKRFYGLLVTLGGTNPDTVASDAEMVWNPQTNLVDA